MNKALWTCPHSEVRASIIFILAVLLQVEVDTCIHVSYAGFSKFVLNATTV